MLNSEKAKLTNSVCHSESSWSMQSKAFDKSVSRRPAKPLLSETFFQLKPVSNVAHYVPYRNHFVILRIMVENINLSDHINIVHKFLIQSVKY